MQGHACRHMKVRIHAGSCSRGQYAKDKKGQKQRWTRQCAGMNGKVDMQVQESQNRGRGNLGDVSSCRERNFLYPWKYGLETSTVPDLSTAPPSAVRPMKLPSSEGWEVETPAPEPAEDPT